MRKSVEGKRSSSEYRPSEFEELAAKSRGARRDSQKRNRLSAEMVRCVCAPATPPCRHAASQPRMRFCMLSDWLHAKSHRYGN